MKAKQIDKENQINKEKQIDKENQRIIDEYDYLSNAASSQDCTGLIPSEPVSTEEIE